MSKLIKIICTLGPATQRKETLIKMAEEGMSIVRLNFSHGSHQDHQKFINIIRSINQEYHFGIKILQDLAGYRIRVGELKFPIELIKYQRVGMSHVKKSVPGTIPLDFDGDLKFFQTGMDVYIDDGKLYFKVVGHEDDVVILEVFQGGRLASRKGVNIPEMPLQANILTEKDRRDIEFGVKNHVDYIAQSFVRNREDIVRVIDLVKPRLPTCQIIAKIENKEGIENLESIMGACDGILVARGDLGVSLPIYQIPMIQKDIIHRCNAKQQMVITATQMLDSMTENARPTRAEVSDVANAILDGSDCVMLSGETAVGTFPVKAVRMMRQIVEYTLSHMNSSR
ncbi:MAG: pyruvate kinase [Candidatus Omnitrophica bacterium]|nr:pyruvate kinase [Candidatus Omnitrophota bacterium]